MTGTTSTNGTPHTASDAARAFLSRGYAPLPLPPRSKIPTLGGWTKLRIAETDIDGMFPADGNIGLLVGAPSGGLIDVDLDSPEAIRAAPIMLPATGMISGRQSAPTSHWWYRVDQPPAKASGKFLDPTEANESKALLLELRSTGGQTLVPPSVYAADTENAHPSAEPCVWHKHGEPAQADTDTLRVAVRALASAALIGRHWPIGARHDAALALAGGLLRANWPDEMVERFVSAVCAAADDNEVRDRITAVRSSAERLRNEENATGWPALAKIIGSNGNAIVGKVREWLGIKSKPKVTFGGSAEKVAAPQRYTPLPPWRPFPTEYLPKAIREFVGTVSTAMRCDPCFVALPAIAVCAGMIGGTRQIRLKKSWCEPVMTWAVVVGDSGTLKTPPYKRAVAPVLALQAAHFKRNKAEMESYRAELREYERAKRKAKDEDPGDPPVEPVCIRMYSRDTTIEALAGLLTNNRSRFLIGRDEISGWLASFNQYKSKGGSDQANWLELHSLGTLCVDRKTGDRPNIFVDGVGVSLCGGIQPGVLRTSLSPQHFSAGVPARLLFAYPPRKPKEWTEDDIDEEVEQRYHTLVKRLAELEPHTNDDGEPYPVTLSMTPDAKTEWVRFYRKFAHKQARTEGDLSAAFSKLEGYAARLSLLHHVCQSVDVDGEALEPVTLASIEAGIALAEWFTSEAERVYQMLGEETQEEEIRKLVESVNRLAVEHGGRVTGRQLQRSNQRKYRQSEAAEGALETLVGMGLGRWENALPSETGGHRTRFFIPCVTGDTCDTRPDDDEPDEDDGGDSRCDNEPSPPDGGGGETDAKDCPESTCDEGEDTIEDRVSHVSPVTHAPEERRRVSEAPKDDSGAPTECHTRTESPDPRPVFRLITDRAGISDVVTAIEDDGGTIGLDIETTGLNHATAKIRLLQLAADKGTFVIDVFAIPNPREAFDELFEVLGNRSVAGHNLNFDLPFLMKLGFKPGRVCDTMLASQVLNAGDRTVRHNLKDVSARVLSLTLDKTEQKANWAKTLTPEMLAYSARDAEIPLQLWERLKEGANTADLSGVLDIEMNALPAVAWASLKGVGFDRAAWATLASDAEAHRDQLREQLDSAAPDVTTLTGTRNWNSPDEVKAAFAAIGITTKSTDDDALATIAHPLAELVREYRSAAKLVGTYGREWLKHVSKDGRVYASWKQIGAEVSGRMSCKEPNLQQLPRDQRYRKCFVAPPGRILVKADYSQIELRIGAKITGDRRMGQAYQRSEDIHTLTARALLGKEDVTKSDRQLAKAVNFGLLFGQGAKGLKAYALSSYGVEMTETEATAHRDKFFKTYPGLRAWHQQVRRELEKAIGTDSNGTYETRTLAFRRRTMAAAKKRKDGTSYPNMTEALNTPVQGSAADGFRKALALLWQRRAECPDAFPVLFIHDEIVIECDADRREQTEAWLRQAMLDGMAPLTAPIPVEVEVTSGQTWGG